VVASEPFDDEPGWRTVPDRTVLTARPGVVDSGPLKAAG
jgi:glutamine amidotransferase